MTICPRCLLPVGGIELGFQTPAQKFRTELLHIWNAAALQWEADNTLSVVANPYDGDTDPARWMAWQAGFYYAARGKGCHLAPANPPTGG